MNPLTIARLVKNAEFQNAAPETQESLIEYVQVKLKNNLPLRTGMQHAIAAAIRKAEGKEEK